MMVQTILGDDAPFGVPFLFLLEAFSVFLLAHVQEELDDCTVVRRQLPL